MAYQYLKLLALVRIALLVIQTEATYSEITWGTCSSRGYQYIDDVDECRIAGVQLGYEDWPYGITGPAPSGTPPSNRGDGGDGSTHPRGCFYGQTNPWTEHGANLAFNWNQASTISCDNHRGSCICTDGIVPVPTTTTTIATENRETTTFLAPRTLTSTSSAPSSSCIYAAKFNTAVRGRGARGRKLRRSWYSSDAAYLDACKASCNDNSRCKGFVDDPTHRGGRRCIPKRGTSGYRKPRKTFFVKGSGC